MTKVNCKSYKFVLNAKNVLRLQVLINKSLDAKYIVKMRSWDKIIRSQ